MTLRPFQAGVLCGVIAPVAAEHGHGSDGAAMGVAFNMRHAAAVLACALRHAQRLVPEVRLEVRVETDGSVIFAEPGETGVRMLPQDLETGPRTSGARAAGFGKHLEMWP